GRTFDLGRTHSPRELNQPIAQLNSGSVGVLLVHGTNPAYSLPVKLGFEAALKKVPFKVSFAREIDETAALCDLILPDHHPLESWGDAAAWSGVRSLVQPAMRPVFNTKGTPEILLAAAKAMGKATGPLLAAASWREAVQAAWGGAGSAWEQSLAQGGDFTAATGGVAAGGGSPQLAGGAAGLDFTPVDLGGDPNGTPIVVYASPNLYDGRGANKPWLQELPDPVTKIVWDHWVEMHPDTMKRLNLKRGDHVALKTPTGTLETAAYDYIGIRPDVFAIGTGQGHTAPGSRYWKRGANAFATMPATYDEASGALAFVSTKGSLTKTGKPYYLSFLGGDPYTGGQSRQMGRGIAQAIPLTAIRGDGTPLGGATHGAAPADSATGAVQDSAHGAASDAHAAPQEHGTAHGDRRMHQPGYVGSPVPADPIAHAAKERPNSAYALQAHHKWAMVVDLNSCNGCQACIIGCNLENNVAFVGKEQVERGREMSWLRIERYYEEEGGRLSVRHVPVMCQHCGAAPCESVCPVYATYHNPEGLNAMIYNRCVGTRYCSNNCPYKVRAFNWFHYEFPAPLNWQLNPDVTVRDKGVMEKCTFCVQRIKDAKDHAKDEGRKVRDGEMVTACQQTCPTNAISFGDLKDPTSRVSQLVAHERGYKIFEDLNTYPAVTYLKKVTREIPA
ncbi:MAG: 4Fe-4S dicluster domain-containing protein, partial [Candidatus Eisenbacteria bacterium]